MTQVCAPHHGKKTTGLVRRRRARSRRRAGRRCGSRRPGSRTRARRRRQGPSQTAAGPPAAVVAVLPRLPLADAALELLLELRRRVAEAKDGQHHLRAGRPRSPRSCSAMRRPPRGPATSVTSTGARTSGVGDGVAAADGAEDGAGVGRGVGVERRRRRDDHGRDARAVRRGIEECLDARGPAVEPLAHAEHVGTHDGEAGDEEDDQRHGGERPAPIHAARRLGVHGRGTEDDRRPLLRQHGPHVRASRRSLMSAAALLARRVGGARCPGGRAARGNDHEPLAALRHHRHARRRNRPARRGRAAEPDESVDTRRSTTSTSRSSRAPLATSRWTRRSRSMASRSQAEWTTTINLRVPLDDLGAGESVEIGLAFALNVGTSPDAFSARLNNQNGVLSFGQWFPIVSIEHEVYGLGDPQISFTADAIRFELETTTALARDAVACPGLISAPETTGTSWACEVADVRDFSFVVNPRFRLTEADANGTAHSGLHRDRVGRRHRGAGAHGAHRPRRGIRRLPVARPRAGRGWRRRWLQHGVPALHPPHAWQGDRYVRRLPRGRPPVVLRPARQRPAARAMARRGLRRLQRPLPDGHRSEPVLDPPDRQHRVRLGGRTDHRRRLEQLRRVLQHRLLSQRPSS